MPYQKDLAETRLTADEILLFPTAQGTRYSISAQGDFGGGSVLLQHLVNDQPVLYVDGTFTADAGIWVFATSDFTRVQLVGATSPDLVVRLIQLKR